MPLNEVMCNDCACIEEYFYKLSERDDLVCKTCKSKNLKVLISSAGLKTINTPEKLKDAIKKRSQEDHKKHAKDRLQRAKERHGNHWF